MDHGHRRRFAGHWVVTRGLTTTLCWRTIIFMSIQPGGDSVAEGAVSAKWHHVLAHRLDEHSRTAAARRFEECGVSAEEVEAALMDGGDTLFAAAQTGRLWAEHFGGALAVALISAEISALAAHVNSRASGLRSVAVAELLDDFSAVTVAEALGVSRQKVYEISRAGLRPPYVNKVPWRP